MTFVSYAQNFEDVVLWRALLDVSNGRYLDIGAQDPDKDSVSKAFYEAGWLGVHVEASPYYANKLRNARPNEEVIQALVGEGVEGAVFFEVPETGLSTGIVEIAEHHRAAGYDVREVRVPCTSLTDILDRFSGEAIHWMKIDVEGMEAEVLRSWGDNAARPWLLSIEATFPNSQTPVHHEWIDEVLARGYLKVYFDGLSMYFVHEDHKDRASAFLAPPNVFDGYAITEDHFSAGLINHRKHLAFQEIEHRLAVSEQQRIEERTDLTGKLEVNWRELEIARLRLTDANAELSKQRADFLAELKAQRALSDTLAADAAAANARSELAAQITEREREVFDSALSALASERDALAKSHTERLNAAQAQLDDVQSQREAALAERDNAAKAHAEQSAVLAALQVEHAVLTTRAAEMDTQTRELLEHAASLYRNLHDLEQSSRNILASRWWKIGEFIGLARRPSQPTSFKIMQPEQWKNMSDQLEDIMPNPGNIDPALHSCEVSCLSDLLILDDEQFVREAYKILLGRKGDPAGVSHYTDAIRRGTSKFKILASLRRSPEGRKHAAPIDGLNAAIRRYTLANMPLLGWALRPLLRTEIERPLERQVRQIASQIGRVRQENRLVLREVHKIKSELDGIRGWLDAEQLPNLLPDNTTQLDTRENATVPIPSASAGMRNPLARYFQQATWNRL